LHIPYLENIKGFWYICRKIKENGKWKHQILKKLGKIPKAEAEQKLAVNQVNSVKKTKRSRLF